MSTREDYETLVDICTPQATWKECCKALPRNRAHTALLWGRKHGPEEYGVTIPHVDRGGAKLGEPVYFAVACDKEGKYTLNSERGDWGKGGARAMSRMWSTQASTAQAGLLACAANERSPVRRDAFEEMAEMAEMIYKRAARLWKKAA